jgi:hypothetical protein
MATTCRYRHDHEQNDVFVWMSSKPEGLIGWVTPVQAAKVMDHEPMAKRGTQ